MPVAPPGAKPPRSARDYALLCQGLAAIVAGRLGLLVFPLARVRAAVRALVGSRHPLPPARRCSPEAVVRAAVSAAIHSPVGSTCLATALVAQAMLLRHGHPSQLRIGVKRKPDGSVAAHAWLELNGRVVVGGPSTEIASYTPLPEMEHLIR